MQSCLPTFRFTYFIYQYLANEMVKLVLKRYDISDINGKKSIIMLKERTGLWNTPDEMNQLIKC